VLGDEWTWLTGSPLKGRTKAEICLEKQKESTEAKMKLKKTLQHMLSPSLQSDECEYDTDLEEKPERSKQTSSQMVLKKSPQIGAF